MFFMTSCHLVKFEMTMTVAVHWDEWTTPRRVQGSIWHNLKSHLSHKLQTFQDNLADACSKYHVTNKCDTRFGCVKHLPEALDVVLGQFMVHYQAIKRKHRLCILSSTQRNTAGVEISNCSKGFSMVQRSSSEKFESVWGFMMNSMAKLRTLQ